MSDDHEQDDPFFEIIGGPPKPPRGDGDGDGADKPAPPPPPPPPAGPEGRLRFAGISSRAWEHPADRAAMAALRKVPGLDALIRKMVGLIGERSLRYLYLANAVRVSERQFPSLHRTWLECCEVLDAPRVPELFVAQTPLVNAGAVGVDEPFVVLNSGTVEILEGDELRVVLGHELGHVLSDHVLYKTMLGLLLNLSLSRLGIPLGNLALLGIIGALREWDRKSELSADRAALLAVQDPRVCFSVHMKLAGGNAVGEMSVDEFVAQAQEYHRAGSVSDGILKLLNLAGQSHPFHVTRLAELKAWAEQEDAGYARVCTGDYPRRDADPDASVYDEVKDGAAAYRADLERSEEPLVRFFQDAGATVSETASNVWSSTRNLFGRLGGKDDDR